MGRLHFIIFSSHKIFFNLQISYNADQFSFNWFFFSSHFHIFDTPKRTCFLWQSHHCCFRYVYMYNRSSETLAHSHFAKIGKILIYQIKSNKKFFRADEFTCVNAIIECEFKNGWREKSHQLFWFFIKTCKTTDKMLLLLFSRIIYFFKIP